MLKVIELFSGIGSQAKALKNINIDHKIVAISDWDINANISYALIHKNKEFNEKYNQWINKFIRFERERERERVINYLSNFTLSRDGKNPLKSFNNIKLEFLAAIEIAIKVSNNLGDINNINSKDLPSCDLITYSFPCQDLSLQGKQKGLIDGKSSSLLWEVKRIIKQLNNENRLPKYLLLENVKSLFSKKYEQGFNEWINFLKKIGYKNHSFTLNSKFFDVPQNRERAFVFSELNQNKFNKNNLIKKQTNENITKKSIKNILDKNFEEWIIPKKGYLEKLNPIKNQNGIAKTKIIGYTTFQSEATAFSKNSISPTITATGALNRIKVIDNKKIRILNSKELWKLMSFDEKDWKNVYESKLINEQYLKKQAGNSIPVKVLEAIFKEIK